MGQVFLGRSRSRRPVAVKVIRPEFAKAPAFRRRFALEVEAARRVGGFYAAQMVDADPDGDPPWLVTAYVPGPSLQAAVDRHGPLPASSIGVLGAGLAEGLAAVHSCGLVHRDLKPSNVLLADDGPRVIDFGIARALDATSPTLTHGVIGTAPFMSPEQARGDTVAPSGDVFSLGSVLAFAATGQSPFGTGPALAIMRRVIDDEPDLSGLPLPLRELVAACLAKTPADRPSTDEVLERLTASTDAPARWLPPAIATMVDDQRTTETVPAERHGSSGTRQTQTTTSPRVRRNVAISALAVTAVAVLWTQAITVATAPAAWSAQPGDCLYVRESTTMGEFSENARIVPCYTLAGTWVVTARLPQKGGCEPPTHRPVNRYGAGDPTAVLCIKDRWSDCAGFNQCEATAIGPAPHGDRRNIRRL